MLITGGAGFVGTNLAHRLSATARRVRLFDNLSRAGRRAERASGCGAARRPGRTAGRRRPRRGAPSPRRCAGVEQVFHFAAQVAVTTSLTDPFLDFDVNARGTLNVLEAIRALDDPPAACSSRPRTRSTAASRRAAAAARPPLRARPTPRSRARGISRGAAARLPQPLRLLEGGRRSVRARLRAHLRAAGGRVSDELHLRAAPVRHRGPGLGRPFPHPRADAASRSRSTATGCRCATSCSSTISSTRCCWRTRHDRRARRAGLQHRRRAGERDHALLELSTSSASCSGERARGSHRAVAPGDQRYYVSDTAQIPSGHRLGAADVASARACGAAASLAAASTATARRARSRRWPEWHREGRTGQPALDASTAASTSAAASRTCRSSTVTPGAARAARARGTARRRAAPRAAARRRARSEVGGFAPDMTVVTTAPSYLFWRCAPPELRVPQETLRALRDVAGILVAVGPHASTTPARDAAQARVPMRRSSASARRSCRALPRPRARWRGPVDRATAAAASSACRADPHATDMAALPALAGRRDASRGTRTTTTGSTARRPAPAPRWRLRAAARITARSARRTTSATSTESDRCA